MESEPSPPSKPGSAPNRGTEAPAQGKPAAPRGGVPPPSPVPPRAAAPAQGGKGEPGIAALLSWLLPGAGHLYVGEVGAAVACFVVVQGLYLLGLKLGDGMGFEYLDPELRSAVAPALSPEVGNLGAFLYQLQHYGFGPGLPRPFPPWLRLGSMLTAASGALNIAVIAHAHWMARTRIRAPRWTQSAPAAVLATLLVPGLGHWFQGRRRRAVVVLALVVGLFAFGTVLAAGTNLSRERHFYYWSGQFLVGLPALAAEAVFGKATVHGDLAYVDAGLVYGCIAGLLNILGMIDAYAYNESRLLGLPLRSSQAKAKEPT